MTKLGKHNPNNHLGYSSSALVRPPLPLITLSQARAVLRLTQQGMAHTLGISLRLYITHENRPPDDVPLTIRRAVTLLLITARENDRRAVEAILSDLMNGPGRNADPSVGHQRLHGERFFSCQDY